MRIDIYIHSESSDFEKRVLTQLANILNNEEKIMSKLDDLEAKVAEIETVEESVITLLEGLKKSLDELKTSDPRLQAIIEKLDADKQKLADAVIANTPSAEG